jgi:CHAT domain
MAIIQRDGVVLELPDYVSVADDPPRGRTRRGVPGGGEPADVVAPDYVADIVSEAADLTLVGIVPLVVDTAAVPAPGRRRARGQAPSTSAQLRVEVDRDEDAVVLVESGGYYSWVIGSKETPSATRRGAPTPTEVSFTVDLDVEADAPTGGGGARRGVVSDALFKPITTIVFKFVARVVVGQLVKRLERSVETGLVKVTGPDPSAWIKPPDPAELTLPTDRRSRVLLFVHGTFSSTRSGFASLAATDDGRKLLENALKAYDLVLGFDHRTLSEDPLENAEQLLAQLGSLPTQHGVDVDVVTHSRGALVLRSLVEQLLTSQNGLAVKSAVMVAGPNAGTSLASPEHWSTLVDLYTNLGVSGCRILALGGLTAASVSTALRESLQAVAILVKALVSEAADEHRVPGLGAMVPGGAFITAINEPPASGRIPSTAYYTVSSDFEVHGLAGPQELPVKLIRLVADGFVNQLMGDTNDLVVDVSSMTSIDPGVPNVVQQSLALGENSATYHSAYFVEPEVLRSIGGWLLAQPPGPDGGQVGGAASPVVGQTVVNLPTDVDTNFAVIDADAPIDVLRPRVRASKPDFAVIRMSSPAGKVSHYALTSNEFLSLSGDASPGQSLRQSGLLQSLTPSPTTMTIHDLEPVESNEQAPWTSRTVVLFDGSPIGVAPAASAGPEGTGVVGPSVRTRGLDGDIDNEVADDDLARLRTRGLPRAGSRTGSAPRTARLEPPPAPAAPPPPPHPPHPVPVPVPEPAPLPPAQAYFRAETDEVVSTTEESLVLVEISLEALENAAGANTQLEKATIDAVKPITVNLVPRVNLAVVGEKAATVDPPHAGEPRTLTFKITGVQAGPGQLLVIAGQGPVDLVKMVLDVVVVDKRGRTAVAGPQRASVGAPIPPMPDATACDQMIIDQSTIVADGKVVQTRFDVRYVSERLDFEDSFETPPIAGDRLAYVTALYGQIEKDWGASASDAERFNKALRAYGGQLFDELIPEPIQKLLWDNRDTIKQIQLNSIDPFIPWEVVHLKQPNGKLPSEERFLASMGLVRWIDGAKYPPRQVNVAIGRARVLAPSYPPASGWQLSETVNEYKFVNETFDATLVNADVDAVMDLLEKPGQFDLFHFAGHGTADLTDIANAGLVVTVRQEGGRWVPVPLTAILVEQYGDLRKDSGNRPLVFLNACQVGRSGYQLTRTGGFAEGFLKAGAGIFVSTLWSVVDEPARKFTEVFYGQLVAGRTVADAATTARQKCRADGDPTWLAYVVYGRPDGRLVRS